VLLQNFYVGILLRKLIFRIELKIIWIKLFEGFTHTYTHTHTHTLSLFRKEPTCQSFWKYERVNTNQFSYKLLSMAKLRLTQKMRNSKTHKTCRAIELKLPTQPRAIQELRTCSAREEFSIPKHWPTQQCAISRNHKYAERVNSSLLRKIWPTQQRTIQAIKNSRTTFATT
jgi:glycyl-tRNA synthetase (class II)